MSDFNNIAIRLQKDLAQVDDLILNFSKGKSPLIQEISHHLIRSGGKRIRPILVILSAKLCGLENDHRVYNLASAVELIHSATLLHDDVVDNSEIRRGKKTASAIWDNKFSILVGDFLFATSFAQMVKSDNLQVLELLAKVSAIIADGEVMQLENSHDLSISLKKYQEIIFSKTAILFSASCEVSGLISKVSSLELQALRDYGKNLGMIFQIVDDILDYNANQKNFGKDIGDDFFEGKVTLPIIFLYQSANNIDKEFIKKKFIENIQNKNRNIQEFNEILKLINQYQSLDFCKNLANEFGIQAKKDLDIFRNNPFYQELISIIDFSLNRLF